MKLKFIKEITILGNRFEMIYDKTHNGGSFSYSKNEMTIGIKSVKDDPVYTLSIISHEVMEAILVHMGGRWDNGRVREYYLFNFSHQTFENAIQLHTEIMVKFIQQ